MTSIEQKDALTLPIFAKVTQKAEPPSAELTGQVISGETQMSFHEEVELSNHLVEASYDGSVVPLPPSDSSLEKVWMVSEGGTKPLGLPRGQEFAHSAEKSGELNNTTSDLALLEAGEAIEPMVEAWDETFEAKSDLGSPEKSSLKGADLASAGPNHRPTEQLEITAGAKNLGKTIEAEVKPDVETANLGDIRVPPTKGGDAGITAVSFVPIARPVADSRPDASKNVNSAEKSEALIVPTRQAREFSRVEQTIPQLATSRHSAAGEDPENTDKSPRFDLNLNDDLPKDRADHPRLSQQTNFGQTIPAAQPAAPSIDVVQDIKADVVPDEIDMARAFEQMSPKDRAAAVLSSPQSNAQLSSVVARQVFGQISAGLSQLGDGGIEIRLNPVELGRITIQIIEGLAGQTANVLVEKPEVLDLLRRNETLLQNEFQDAGFASMPFSFDQQQDSEQDQGQEFVAEKTNNDSVSTSQTLAAPTRSGSADLDIRL